MGSSGSGTPSTVSRPPLNRILPVARSWVILAALIFQLGFLGHPFGPVTGQAEYQHLPACDIAGSRSSDGCNAAAAFAHDQQIVDGAVA
jgi:hypothetical protein